MANEKNDPKQPGQQTNPGYPGGVKPGQEPDLKPGKQPEGGEQSDLPGGQDGGGFTR